MYEKRDRGNSSFITLFQVVNALVHLSLADIESG
jgi:hypothetical protein